MDIISVRLLFIVVCDESGYADDASLFFASIYIFMSSWRVLPRSTFNDDDDPPTHNIRSDRRGRKSFTSLWSSRVSFIYSLTPVILSIRHLHLLPPLPQSEKPPPRTNHIGHTQSPDLPSRPIVAVVTCSQLSLSIGHGLDLFKLMLFCSPALLLLFF